MKQNPIFIKSAISAVILSVCSFGYSYEEQLSSSSINSADKLTFVKSNNNKTTAGVNRTNSLIDECIEPAKSAQNEMTPHGKELIPIDGCDGPGGGGTGGGGTGGGGTGGGGTGGGGTGGGGTGGGEECLEGYKTNLNGSAMRGKIPVPIDDCDGGTGGGNDGPTRAPGTPSSVSNIAYTNGTSHRVNWGTSNGYGHGVNYQVYEQKNNGSWNKIYEGYGRSKSVSNRGKGIYRYRVRGCNDKGCSGFRYGSKMAINPLQESNLYTKYPVLNTIDQRNVSYHSNEKSFETSQKRVTPVGQTISGRTSSEERFYLGDGYDLIRGALRETCLDTTHNDFHITKTTPLQPSTFDVEYVNNNRHLAELLDVTDAGRVGFTYDDFTLGLSDEKNRYMESITDDTHVRFVVKWVKRAKYWKLNTPTDPIITELTTNILRPNDSEAKADFRERCGDNYINAANLGAALYLVFTFDAKKYSFEERINKKGQLGAVLEDVFSVGGTRSLTTSEKQLISSLNVTVHADQVGGPEGISASITPNNFNSKYNQFIQGTNSDNWAAVDFETQEYQRPTIYNNYSHDQIFANYAAPFAQMKRWADISVQLKERCDAYGGFGISLMSGECGQAEANMGIAMDSCRKTREWDLCKHPAYYQTGSFTTVGNGVNLLSWLSTNVKKLNEDDVFESYPHEGNKKTISDETCLRHNQCYANKFRGSGVGIGKGFVIDVTNYDNRGGTHPSYKLINGNQCVHTSAYLKKNWFANPKPKFHYNINFEGVCADQEDFVVIN